MESTYCEKHQIIWHKIIVEERKIKSNDGYKLALERHLRQKKTRQFGKEKLVAVYVSECSCIQPSSECAVYFTHKLRQVQTKIIIKQNNKINRQWLK